MSNAEYNLESIIESLATAGQNLHDVQVDLSHKQTPTFEAMLQSMLAWKDIKMNMLLDDDEERLKAKGTAEYDNLLDAAIEFCNLAQRGDSISQWDRAEHAQMRDSNYCKLVKESLYDYCNETDPYTSLTTALNLILAWTLRDEPDSDPDIIFVTNYPTVIRSSLLRGAAKRKPDIICLPLRVLRGWISSDYKDLRFDGLRMLVNKGIIPSDSTRSWSDIDQFVEVQEQPAKLKMDFLGQQYSRQGLTDIILGPQSTQATLSDNGATGSNVDNPCKRKSESVPTSSNKKARSQSRQTREGSPVEDLGFWINVPTNAQTAYYAIERLRSSWEFTHATGIYISGTELNIRWYDAEGCIESTPIDIIQHLPLLVVFLDVMQRSKRLRGYGSAKKILDGIGTIHADTRTRPHFELSGRRTYGANFTLKSGTPLPTIPKLNALSGSNNAAPDDAQHFFKVAWPEICRDNEPHILQVALDRAAKHLPVEHQEAVTGHLPDIVHYQEVEGTSTAIIRRLLGLPTTDSRVQLWTVSKKLSGLETLLDPMEFWKAFWEIIRCHHLLWLIGIAHGDISLSNCMLEGLKGVLNDFDLSTVMEVDASTPRRTGYERTGTKPFMALDLLTESSHSGVFPRLYRHELESFSWVLLWAGLCVPRVGPPFNKWLTLDNRGIYLAKFSFAPSFSVSSKSTVLFNFTERTLKAWLNFWFDFHIAWLRREPQGRLEEGDTCRDFTIEMIRLMDGLDLPMEKSWLDVQILNVN